MPKNTSKKIEAKLRNFFWNGTDNKKKAALIKWENICRPKKIGGLGIKNLMWQNEALGAKLAWRMFQNKESKWARILYNKYLNPNDPISLFRTKNPPQGSITWNFISKCRHLISKYATWDIGDGKNALFWEDSWNGLPRMNTYNISCQTINLLKASWGLRVQDYLEQNPSNEENSWRWKPLSNLNIPINDQTTLEGILHNRKIYLSNKEDKLRWALSNDGAYKVKEGYNSILHSQRWEEINIPMNLCWDPAILPKAGIFLWAALQNRILTTDRIIKMGFHGPSRCILCKQDNETVDHLLYQCPFSIECWHRIKGKLNWTSPLPANWKEHIQGWPKSRDKNIYDKIWNITPAITA